MSDKSQTAKLPSALIRVEAGSIAIIESNHAFREAACEDDLAALESFIRDATPSIQIVQMKALREYTLAAADRPHTYSLTLQRTLPFAVTGDALRKKEHCLAKAKRRSQAEYEHVKDVFVYATELDRFGPIETWPDVLWRALYSLFDCNSACAIEWGHDLRILYNFDYSFIAGHRHPRAIGLPMRHPDCWAELMLDIGPQMLRVLNGEALHFKEVRFSFSDKDDGCELEQYFDYSFFPIDDDNGVSLGVMNTATNCTEQVFNHRCFVATMPAIVRPVTYATRPEDFFENLKQGIQVNPLDLPSVLVYNVQDSIAQQVIQIGVKDEAQANLPQQHMLGTAAPQPLSQLLNQMSQQTSPIHISDPQIMDAFIGKDGKHCREGLLFPINSEVTSELLATIFIGLNPARRLDGSYRDFLDLLISRISSGIRNMCHMKAQLAHHQDLANLNAARSAELQQALEQRTKELQVSELRFTNMAKYSPAGIFLIDAQGAVIYVNDAAWTLAGAKKPSFERIESLIKDVRTWVHESCIDHYTAQFMSMYEKLHPLHFEYRAANDWPDGTERWVRLSTRVELNDDGTARLFHGFCMDVTPIKQVEILTEKRIADAIESKRQQEAFIDMTSHEMRNPLSAIGQTAELISAGLNGALSQDSLPKIRAAVTESLDMLGNIDLLARHMRCIADDMIAISKIDSGILTVRPTAIVVTDFLQQVLGMFAAEAKAQQIRLSLDTNALPADTSETRCLFDPARVSQILINLIANAIKHIRRSTAVGETERLVNVAVRIAGEAPFPMDIYGAVATLTQPQEEQTPATTPARSEHPVEQYLIFSVQDNGPGMPSADADALFKRFTERGPKTHNKYGGSGLSLFICRRLSELQGGQIRTEQPADGAPGTRFVFYLRAPPCDDGHVTTTTPMESLSDDYFAHFTRPMALGHSPSEVLIPSPESPAPPYNMAAIPRSEPTAQPVTPAQDVTNKIRALIVEDNVLNQRLLQKQLQKAGYDVEVANNGLECLNIVREEPSFDVILLDREMPVCDGLACLLQLRKMEQQGEIVPRERKSSTLSTGSLPTVPETSTHRGPLEADGSDEQDFAQPAAQLQARFNSSFSGSSSVSPTKTPDLPIGSATTPSGKRRRSDGISEVNKKQHLATDNDEPERVMRSKLAVITISANARSEQIQEMMNAGSDDYVTKPFRFPDLDARIKKLLSTLAEC